MPTETDAFCAVVSLSFVTFTNSGRITALSIFSTASKVLNSKEGDEYIVWTNNEIKKKSDYFVKAFKEETNLTGLVITKLDGTAKGGVAIGIVAENKIPIKFIGVGEQIDDMEIFNSEDFVKAII